MTILPRGVTALLSAWSDGDRSALDDLVPLVYEELHRLAHHYMRGERRGRGLDTTVVVHEAYLRLAGSRGLRCENRMHFFAVCAGLMRRILVDIARQEHAEKRGGAVRHVPFAESLAVAPQPGPNLVAVDEALDVLALDDPRKARVVELRYFGGLSVEETAHALGLSRVTVLRDWKLAKAWLWNELSRTDIGRAAERP